MQKELEPDFSPISDDSIRKLRLQTSDLISEVESLVSLGSRSTYPREPIETESSLEFYEEVKRFEIALIKSALHRTGGNQVRAAAFLNLDSSTLNAKIRQHNIGCLLSLN